LLSIYGQGVRVLSIVHQPDAGPGVFAEAIEAHGVEHHQWLIAAEAEPPDEPFSYDAVMTFGGAMNCDQEDRYGWLRPEKELLTELLERETPLLGVSLGSQLLAEAAGAPPERLPAPEIGWHEVGVSLEASGDPLLAPLAPRFSAFQWHSYAAPLPPGATQLAESAACLQAYRIGDWAWGIQFHAEVTAEDAERWTADYRSDPDAVRVELDPDALREDTAAAIGSWNELGRGLCGRFLDVAGGS
jgi:GMP synthase-like glutamine amidotransferase